MHCRVPGCHRRTSRWGAFCNTHKSRDRRHGDPNQETITSALLKPYLSLVKARIERNEGRPLWPLLEDRWKTLLDQCRGYLAMCESGAVFQKDQRRACQELSRLADYVEPRTVIETVLALFMMLDMEARRFRSDRSFRFQLARRVRGLADVNASQYYDHGSGRVKRVYRDLSPRATERLARMVADALGVAGLHLARLERQQAEKQQAAVRNFGEALAEIT
jgi:hypothetical protein